MTSRGARMLGKLWAVGVAVGLILLFPVASAGIDVYAGYHNGPVDLCVFAGTDGISTDPADCTPLNIGSDQFVGEVSAGARAEGITVCLLVDEDGNIHLDCSPCALVSGIVSRDPVGITCFGNCEAANICSIVTTKVHALS